LTHILNWGQSAFVGQERFASLLNRQPDAFVPDLFESDRLARFIKGDCGYSSYSELREYGAEFACKKEFDTLGENRFIGDKITALHRFFPVFSSPEWDGKDVTVIHVVRNVLDVANSYQTRLENPNDRWTR